MKKRTKFTILAMFAIVCYTVCVIVMNAFEKSVPSELTISWFSAWTVELGLLYGIRIKDKGDN